MPQDRKSVHRKRLREQGLRPLEVWLPQSIIQQIDELKVDGDGRDATIAMLLTKTLETRGAHHAKIHHQLGI